MKKVTGREHFRELSPFSRASYFKVHDVENVDQCHDAQKQSHSIRYGLIRWKIATL